MSSDAYRRFVASMNIDHEKWRDGIGYDLGALGSLAGAERQRAEALLLARAGNDWRDVEALAALGSPAAREALRAAFASAGQETKMAILQHAPEVVDRSDQVSSLVEGIEAAEIFGGLSQTMDQAIRYHPPPVIYALHRAILRRGGGIAIHLARLLSVIHGQSESIDDDDNQVFLQRFNTEDSDARYAAYLALCDQLGALPIPKPRS